MRYSYDSERIVFQSFVDLPKTKLLDILAWRNNDNIRKWMKSDSMISLDTHLSFVEKLKQDSLNHYWLVSRKGRDCAVVYLNVNSDNSLTAEWGFYMAPQFLETGISLEVCFYALNIFFNEFNIEQLYGIILSENIQNLNLQKKVGFKLISDCEKDGKMYYTALMEKKYFHSIARTFTEFQKELIWKKK